MSLCENNRTINANKMQFAQYLCMAFLTTNDYHTLIDPDDFLDLLLKYPNKLVRLESYAQEEISTYLRGRYDLSKVFAGGSIFNILKTYQKGDLVIETIGFITKYYECQVNDTVGIDPNLPTQTSWIEKDTRNSIIVWCMVVIVIYNLCVAIVPRDIPEIRKYMYYGIDDKQQDGALFKLKMIQSGKLVLDLPLLSQPQIPSTFITVGSESINEIDF